MIDGGPVAVGPITAGHGVIWVAPNILGDSGSPAVTGAPPTQQTFLTGTAQTYNRPAGVRQIRVRMMGGGGGGSGAGVPATDGADGTATIFNGIAAAPGGGGQSGGRGGVGGSGGAGVANFRVSGQCGLFPCMFTNGAIYYLVGGVGAGTGNGITTFNVMGATARANSGAGGGGGTYVGTAAITSLNSTNSGYGGAQGEFVELLITNPAASYVYTVGGGGNGGTGTGPGTAGGNGGSGYIVVDEYY